MLHSKGFLLMTDEFPFALLTSVYTFGLFVSFSYKVLPQATSTTSPNCLRGGDNGRKGEQGKKLKKMTSSLNPNLSPPLNSFLHLFTSYFYTSSKVFLHFCGPEIPLHSSPFFTPHYLPSPLLKPRPPLLSHLPLPPHFSDRQPRYVLCSPLFLLSSTPTLALLLALEELTRPAPTQTSPN